MLLHPPTKWGFFQGARSGCRCSILNPGSPLPPPCPCLNHRQTDTLHKARQSPLRQRTNSLLYRSDEASCTKGHVLLPIRLKTGILPLGGSDHLRRKNRLISLLLGGSGLLRRENRLIPLPPDDSDHLRRKNRLNLLLLGGLDHIRREDRLNSSRCPVSANKTIIEESYYRLQEQTITFLYFYGLFGIIWAKRKNLA